MSSFKLEIETDGAAFANADGEPDDEARNREVGRLLRQTAERLRTGGGTTLRDANGNTVGAWGFSE